MKNSEIADIFERLADILEFKGEVVFKVNSYRKSARTLRDTAEDIAVISAEDRLLDMPGIGKSTAEKIRDYLETGMLRKYEQEREGLSDELIRMLQIPGMGPKTLALIHSKLKTDTFEALEGAVEAGFGHKEWIEHDSDFDALREDPRFQKLLAALGADGKAVSHRRCDVRCSIVDALDLGQRCHPLLIE